MTNCLVIDDVTVSRFAARAFLEQMDIEVTEASDKKSALSCLKSGGIDVILLDWHLKKESGLELLENIREEYGSGIKVIVFSGIEGQDKASEAKKAGANEFICKPTTKEKIEIAFKTIGVL